MPSDLETAAEAIRPEDLEEDIRQISADETEGRSPASEGDRMARSYMAQQLAAIIAARESLNAGEQVELDQDTVEELQALGYL